MIVKSVNSTSVKPRIKEGFWGKQPLKCSDVTIKFDNKAGQFIRFIWYRYYR